MAFAFTFNGVEMGALGVTINAGKVDWSPAPQFDSVAIPQSDVALANSSRFQAMQIAFGGIVEAASAAALQTALDAIAKALNVRTDAALLLDTITGRYWMARPNGALGVERYTDWAKLEFSFIANDPHAFASSETDSTQTWPVASWAITPGGTHEIKPAWIFEASGAATVVALENADTDERVAWVGTLAAGNRLKFGAETWRVYFDAAGGDDWTLSMSNVSGVFPRLLPAVENTIRLLAPAAGSLRVIYRERYV